MAKVHTPYLAQPSSSLVLGVQGKSPEGSQLRGVGSEQWLKISLGLFSFYLHSFLVRLGMRWDTLDIYCGKRA